MNKSIRTVRQFFAQTILFFYRKSYISYRKKTLRNKRIIVCVFVLHDLGSWKSESLYLEMLKHPRFNPIIVVIPNSEHKDTSDLKKYLIKKNYDFHEIEEPDTICKKFNADIIFYQKPYVGKIPGNFGYRHNLKALFCYVNYGFHGVDEVWSRDTELHFHCWQIYYENLPAWKGSANIMRNKCSNGYITGLPVMDELLISKEKLNDPWKKVGRKKKRIIWAPHHSINPENPIQYSTFMRYCDFMIQLAKKYQDSVQWTFKPHPLLKSKLEIIWGIEKTEKYYKTWEEMDNSQLEAGKYLELFKYSDAMIHDCGSFTVEYHYTHNPVLYLMKGDNVCNGFNEFQQSAFDLHYKAWNENDIENFINNVISGKDPLKSSREQFFLKYLVPPENKSASENIIDCILNKEFENKCKGHS